MKTKINLNATDIINQVQQIDYSLLLQIVSPIIVYYITSRSIKNYKLYKGFIPSDVHDISLPPEMVKKASQVDKERLLKQRFGDSVVNFATTIVNKMPNADLTLFYNNLSSLTTRQRNYKISHLLLKTSEAGAYIAEDNKILLDENNYTLTIDHELFHVSSTICRESDGMIFSGFMQQPNGKKRIATGINEGYTQLLAERYFLETKEILPAYKFEKNIAERLELIIEKEKMESLYLNANLHGLIQELKKYENENAIMQFIADVDFLSEYLHVQQFLQSAKNIIEIKLKSINKFLVNCYIKKILEELNSGVLSIEALHSKLSSYLDITGDTVKVGKIRYSFMTKEELKEIITEAIKIKKLNEDDSEHQEQISILK